MKHDEKPAQPKKLTLNVQTLRELTAEEAAAVVGAPGAPKRGTF